MTAEKKIAHHRLTLLQVAERIRNVSEACRRHGVSRSQDRKRRGRISTLDNRCCL